MITVLKKLVFILLVSPIAGFGQGYTFQWTGMTPTFGNNLSSQVSYIDFGEASIWGYMEINLTYGYDHQLSTGVYGKRFNVGRNLNAPFYANTSEVYVALGPVAEQWKLGELEINPADNHLRLPIYHLASTQNAVLINVNGTSIAIYVPTITITNPATLTNTEIRDYVFTRGPVSIGTNKLDAGSQLTVAGKINARELKVNVNAGADMVFDQNYKLLSLHEIKTYVDANKHLPEIPSASEMVKNGINISEFQVKLLQKIEELTLHLIEKDKQLSLQGKRIRKLEEMVKTLINKK